MRRHDGDISVSSAKGEGTTFSIELLLAGTHPSESTTQQEVANGHPQIHILVAEDETEQQAILQEYLGIHGHTIDVVNDEAQALDCQATIIFAGGDN